MYVCERMYVTTTAAAVPAHATSERDCACVRVGVCECVRVEV